MRVMNNKITKEQMAKLSPELRKALREYEQSPFRYYNLNPNGNRTGDCVIRAIGAAMGKTWEEVLKDLYEYSLKHKLFLGNHELYGIYLQDNGWTKHQIPYKRNGNMYCLKEWIKKHNKPALVIIDGNHLTYVINQKVYDIWDCTEHMVHEYWTYN